MFFMLSVFVLQLSWLIPLCPLPSFGNETSTEQPRTIEVFRQVLAPGYCLLAYHKTHQWFPSFFIMIKHYNEPFQKHINNFYRKLNYTITYYLWILPVSKMQLKRMSNWSQAKVCCFVLEFDIDCCWVRWFHLMTLWLFSIILCP